MGNLCRIWRKLLIERQGIGSIHKWICVRDEGYWQLGLSKRSRPYTAFETPKGLFQFRTYLLVLLIRGPLFVVLYAYYCKAREMWIVL